MKRFRNITVGAVMILTAASLLNGCAKKAEAPAASTAETAVGTETAAETTAESETEKEVKELSFLDVEIEEYKRVYPDEGEQMLSATCESISIKNDGFEKLNNSLMDFNIVTKDTTDYIFEEISKEFMETELTDFEKSMLPYSADSFISLFRKDTNVLSFTNTDSEWLGGAHPTSFLTGHNFDAQTGERLDIRNVVADYDRLYEKVVGELEEIEEDAGFFDDWRETVEAEFMQTKAGYAVNYLMTAEGITIMFNTYEIAPYASGPQFIDILYKDDPELFNAKYFPDELEAAYKEQDTSM